MQPIRAAAVQFQHAPGNKAANLETIRRFVGQAHSQRIDLLVFPECCISGYWHLRKLSRNELEALAEPLFQGPSSQALGKMASDTGMSIGAGLIERADDGRLFNAYVVALPDGRFVRHRKLHAFIHPAVSSGDEFTVFDDPHGFRAGVLICYDNNLGENVRITALAGAEILLAPHQTGGCDTGSPLAMGVIERRLWDERHERPESIEREILGPKGREWLMRWLPARAHDNGLFLVFSNGVGPDDDEVRTGNAMILDPYGSVLAESCKAGDDLVTADLDPALRDRCTGARWIRTRRPELYSPLCRPTGREESTRQVRFEHLNGGDDR